MPSGRAGPLDTGHVWYGCVILNRSTTNHNTSKALGRVRSRGSLSFERAELSRDDERRPWRLSNHAPHSVAVLASPCFPDSASPFQSARKSASRQAVPGGLKGRAAVGGAPTLQAEREPAAPSGSRRCAPTTARDLRSLGPLARQRRARTPQTDGRGAQRGPREARQGRTRARTSQRRPEGADRLPVVAAPRAPRGLSRWSRFVPHRITLDHPYHTLDYRPDDEDRPREERISDGRPNGWS